MTTTLIKNGLICKYDSINKMDLLIAGNKIAEIAPELAPDVADEILDAEGCFLLPGLLDIHTHLDDQIGGYELADSYESGSQIAILNGITTLYSFITQDKNKSLKTCVDIAKNKAQNLFTNLGWHLTPTSYDQQTISELEQYLEAGFKTIKLYTTYKNAGIYSRYDEIEFFAKILRKYNASILVHCEDDEILNLISRMASDSSKIEKHSSLRPESAEQIALKKILEIARKTLTHFHIVHVSSPESIRIIRDFDLPELISCETAPQYLYFDASKLNTLDGFKFLCTPPFRSKESAAQLKKMAEFGHIDLFATDHCAFTRADKAANKGDLSKIPMGLPGIGALPHLIYKLHEQHPERAFKEMVKRLSENPAKLVGLFPQKGKLEIGADADLVLFELQDKAVKIKSSLMDVYDVFDEFESNLSVRSVFLSGNKMVKNNKLVKDVKTRGKILC